MRHRHVTAAAALTSLLGCSAVAPMMQGDTQDAGLAITASVLADAYTTQALIAPITHARLNHVVVQLATVANGVETPVLSNGAPVAADLDVAHLGSALSFAHLKRNTSYRVRGKAYQAPGTALADRIEDPNASYVDVTTAQDDHLAAVVLPIKLRDQVFHGTATNGLQITAGSLGLVPNPSPTPTLALQAQPVTLEGGGQVAIATYTQSDVVPQGSLTVAGPPAHSLAAPPLRNDQRPGPEDEHTLARRLDQQAVEDYLRRHPRRAPHYKLEAFVPPLALGTVQPFWVEDNDKPTYHDVQIQARLVALTDHAYVFADTGLDAGGQTPATVVSTATTMLGTFETNIYPTDRAIYGSEPFPGNDNDPHVYFVISPAVDAAAGRSQVLGFFQGSNEFAPDPTSQFLQSQHSNNHEMMFLAADYLTNQPLTVTLATLAHEFQHMIHFNQKVFLGDGNYDPAWIDEGCSKMAEDLNGYGPATAGNNILGFIRDFLAAPEAHSLTNWDANPLTEKGYGIDYMFFSYLRDRFGQGILTEIVQAPFDGQGNVNDVLVKHGTTLDAAFRDFAVALALDGLPGNQTPAWTLTGFHTYWNVPDGTLLGPITTSVAAGGTATFTPLPYSVRYFSLPANQGGLTLGPANASALLPGVVLP